VSPSRPEWLPDSTQELLIRSALAGGDEALGAWREWLARAVPDDDPTPFQILPLAYRNIHRLDPGADGLDYAKGVYRYVWVKNQLLMRFGGETIAALERAGVRTLVLKGAAMTRLHYRDLGLRLMEDIDVLVPRQSTATAIRVLSGTLVPDDSTGAPEDRIPVTNGIAWGEPSGNSVDLHWYALWQSSPDDSFWSAAVPVEVGEASTLALCDADQLLHVCAHGARWHPHPVLRWIPDAATVIAGGGVDWDRFVSEARSRELTVALAEALAYLQSAGFASIPPEVLTELGRTRASYMERAARRSLARRPSVSGVLLAHWDRYSRMRRLDPTAQRPSSFPQHLRLSWGFESYGELVRHGVRRLARRRGGEDSWPVAEPTPDI
jgi:Uncharacterised nucleotidyltransferase